MTEEQPFKGADEMESTKVPLKGPNVISTFDAPPHPDAVKAHEASSRRHLKGQSPEQDTPGSEQGTLGSEESTPGE
jgi:hypothetical protein